MTMSDHEAAHSLQTKRRQLGYEAEQIAISISRLNALSLIEQLDGEAKESAQGIAADCLRWIEEHRTVVLAVEAEIADHEARNAEIREQQPAAIARPGIRNRPYVDARCSNPDCGRAQAVDPAKIMGDFLGELGWTGEHPHALVCPFCSGGGTATCDGCGTERKVYGDDEEAAKDELRADGWTFDGEDALCQPCSP